ncbi:metallophosphoesterase [Sphingomonas bacterium]|uniref:metallophosphoesterase n=1 Tax=Sphingomonas bacterium TaxID=1895847 RepID=UPI002A0F545D|nr:phosphodiesterase [Sphingomonas bacterium]
MGFVLDDPDEMNARRLDAVLDRLKSLPTPPDALIASGDLTERGDEASYRRLRAKLEACPFPVHYALGNHDTREGFAAAFPDLAMPGGFFQYAADCGELRLLVLDTLEPGRHGGGFDDARAAWLAERLDEAPERPTIIVLHHPPIETGIDWLTTDPAEPWVRRLADTIAGRGNIVALVSGHIHRSITGQFAGFPVVVCPPTAPVAALELAPIDPDRPDGRPIIVDTPPAYALHLWRHGQLISHVDRVERQEPVVSYDKTMQPLMRKVFGERP